MFTVVSELCFYYFSLNLCEILFYEKGCFYWNWQSTNAQVYSIYSQVLLILKAVLVDKAAVSDCRNFHLNRMYVSKL